METDTLLFSKYLGHLFKSYYVVWKQKSKQAKTSFAKGLNRTM